MMQSALTILADSRINSFLYIYTIPKGGLSDHILHASCGRNSCGVPEFGIKCKIGNSNNLGANIQIYTEKCIIIAIF